MKKRLLPVSLCVLAMSAALFSGCGLNQPAADTETVGAQSTDDNQTAGDMETTNDTEAGNAAEADNFANIESLFADEELKADINAQYEALSNESVVMTVDGKGNQLIVTASCLEYEYSADVAAAFEQTLDGMEDSMVSQANQFTSLVEEPDVSILVQYLDKNGEELASRTFYAE